MHFYITRYSTFPIFGPAAGNAVFECASFLSVLLAGILCHYIFFLSFTAFLGARGATLNQTLPHV